MVPKEPLEIKWSGITITKGDSEKLSAMDVGQVHSAIISVRDPIEIQLLSDQDALVATWIVSRTLWSDPWDRNYITHCVNALIDGEPLPPREIFSEVPRLNWTKEKGLHSDSQKLPTIDPEEVDSIEVTFTAIRHNEGEWVPEEAKVQLTKLDGLVPMCFIDIFEHKAIGEAQESITQEVASMMGWGQAK